MTPQRPIWLPELCRIEAMVVVVLGAELVALVAALAPSEATVNPWRSIAPISLYVQWLALSCTVSLCLLRKHVGRFEPALGGALCWLLCVLICLIGALAVTNLDPSLYFGAQNLASSRSGFVLSSTAMSALVAAAGLRYAFVHSQWQQQVKAKARAEADALQARIRPHFLFNSLNTIAALIDSNPAAAEEATLDLADLFRASLKAGEDLIELRNELQLTRSYLAIEGQRLGDRLQLDWQVDLPEDLKVPPLILQPLVENAVYHGVAQLPGGGTIRVRGGRVGAHWQIEVSNPAPPAGTDTHHGTGMAQVNIRARLRQCFGDRSDLQIESSTNYYCARLLLPVGEE